MSVKTSDLVNNMEESATLAMAVKARELKNKGRDIISLSLGEPDFDTPTFIKEAAINAIKSNYSHYTPVNGLLEVRESISKKFLRDNDLNYSPDQIVISTGAKQSLWNIVQAIINEGDEVVLPTPYWVSYDAMAKMAKGIVITIETDIHSDFKMTPNSLEEVLNEKSRLLIFSSPCNPSGSVYTKTELEELVKIIEKFPNLIVVSDEIYELINFSGKHFSLANFPSIAERVVTVNGVSKGFAMTGYRIGYIGAPLWLAKACTKIQGQVTSGANAVAQIAAKAAVEVDPKELDSLKAKYLSRRDLVLNELNKIEKLKLNTPQGAFYIYPDVSNYFGKSFKNYTINNATDLCMYLLEEEGIALVTGEAFGTKNDIRISYATSDEILLEACKRIKKGLDQLT